MRVRLPWRAECIGQGMAAIELLCRRHAERNPNGAGVTVVDGLWAYCPGDASEGHDWTRIPPTDAKWIELPKSAEETQPAE